ncbi:MAG: hypothetical protein ABI910_00835 [Gemmatimonadota bacterium]
MTRAILLRLTATTALWYGTSLAAQAAVPPTGSFPVDPRLYAGLAWRNVGPFRGGRVAAVSGVVGAAGTFYAGFPAGGVWKTTSAGQTWFPVFDDVHEVSSVGAVEVAPSAPDVVYVGTGDMISGGTLDRGNGVYKSTDAGKSWQHLGLEATRHIQTILVDPRDPDVVMVGALGDAMHTSDARGVFRSTDGGRTWTKTLYVDDQTGIAKLARAFDVPAVIFATTMRHYAPPDYAQERLRSWQFSLAPRPDSQPLAALYKSTDGGVTWHEVRGGGLPPLVGRMSVAVAMGTSARRVYLITNTALWRSDDGGTSWRQVAADDPRIHNGQGGYSCGVYVDPRNPDVVYTLNTASYRSTDGGLTFTGLKGAPGGDDPQQMWIDPTNGDRLLLGYDQGLTVSLDGGTTWSGWYNQSTEQLYHVAADNSYPPWLYATQQDAGAIRTRGRGNYGAVTIFDWNSVNGWEWGTLAPDPLDPNTVYASGSGVVKISYPSEQWIDVSPAVDPAMKARATSSQPLAFSPLNPHRLLLGLNFVAATIDGGAHWTRISPDLGIASGIDTTAASGVPGSRGAIESLSASPVAEGTIWIGTSNGLIHVTRDNGKSWRDVSIAGIPSPRRANVSAIEASHYEVGTAYAAIEYLRAGDLTPYIYRTRDFGRTWIRIVSGLPTDEAGGSFARVVREDPRRRGLLFTGTESGLHVSFDDGDHWQSLMQNLPTTPVRDITIKGNDLIAATHGRGIWILDDISSLRQLSSGIVAERAHLFAPGETIRVRRNVNADTPLPPEIPHAPNPASGVIIDYWLADTPSVAVALDVFDARGRPVRHLSSAPIALVPEAARPPHANVWVEIPRALPTRAGTNRVNWDLRRDAPPAFTHGYEINANPGLTPATPQGALVPPGTYTLQLTVGAERHRQTVLIRNDPRSPASARAVEAQDSLLVRISNAMGEAYRAAEGADALRAAVAAVEAPAATAALPSAAGALLATIDSLVSSAQPTGLRALNGALAQQLGAQDNGDMAPTPSMQAAVGALERSLRAALVRWRQVVAVQLPELNAALTRAGRPTIAPPPTGTVPHQ